MGPLPGAKWPGMTIHVFSRLTASGGQRRFGVPAQTILASGVWFADCLRSAE